MIPEWPGTRRHPVRQYWKRHDCVGCGSAYRYSFGGLRKTAPRGGKVPDMRPCPTCGLYQPDMVGTRRLRLHLLFGLIGLIGVGITAGFGIGRVMPDRMVIGGMAAMGGAVLLGQLLVLVWNPNRNLDANRRRARQLIKSDNMELLHGDNPAKAASALPHFGFRRAHMVALIGLLVAIGFFVTGELVRLGFGWPVNSEWRPSVVGPGDQSRIFFPSLQSIDGRWSGEATAHVVNASELGLTDTRLSVQTNQDTWGGTIHVESNKQRSWFSPWVDVRIPESAQLAGKEIVIHIDLQVTSPVVYGNEYRNEQARQTRTVSLQLANQPGAGRLYTYALYGGGILGAVGMMAMSLTLVALAVSLRRTGSPMRLVEEQEEDDEDENRRGRRRRKPTSDAD
jgi:hypothetical protein